jgi:hypothetical protein
MPGGASPAARAEQGRRRAYPRAKFGGFGAAAAARDDAARVSGSGAAPGFL